LVVEYTNILLFFKIVPWNFISRKLFTSDNIQVALRIYLLNSA
jgi:hypothetical protein